jgi:hypothetical protein
MRLLLMSASLNLVMRVAACDVPRATTHVFTRRHARHSAADG